MTKKLTWRLSKLPTVEELLQLVKDKVITQEEAKEILFNSGKEVKENTPDIGDLEEEIKFLRKLVEKLSNNNKEIIIREIEIVKQPYWNYRWYKPYNVWMNSISNNQFGNSLGIDYTANSQAEPFSSIKTF